MDRFATCLPRVLKHEGGYSNHPNDPGGPTNRGVTQKVYDAYRAKRGLAIRSVKDITDHEIADIYRRQYWDAVRGDDLPIGVDYAAFDYAVNSGPGRAAKALQVVVGVTPDGAIGEVTLAALGKRQASDVAGALCDRRLAFLRSLRTWKTFQRGWGNRVADVKHVSVREAAGMSVGASRPVILPDADAQSAGMGRGIPPAKPASPSIDKTIAVGTAGAGALTGILQAITSPWAAVALVALVIVGAVAAWRLWPRQTMPEAT